MKLQHALALARRGFKVFPIKANAKTPPLVQAWPKRATSDARAVRAFWAATPDANIAIHCEGLLVVDIDTKKGGDVSLEALIDLGLDVNTLTTLTPSGGRHLFYRLPDGHPGVPNSVSTIDAGLDVRSTGGYVLAPGSSIDGAEYRFEDDTPMLPAPPGLVQELGQAAKKEHSAPALVPDATEAVVERALAWLGAQGGAVEGQGGDARTFAVACGLRDRGLSVRQAFALMAGDWNGRCSPPWLADDLRTKVENAYHYASGAVGGKAALPEDFPVYSAPKMFTGGEHSGETINPETGEITGAVPLKARHIRQGPQRLADFAEQPRRRAGYVIKGLLQSVSFIFLGIRIGSISRTSVCVPKNFG